MGNLIAARRAIDACDLTQNEAMVLDVLGRGTVSVGSIVIFTGLRNAAVSRVLSDLDKRGLIIREIANGDRRSVVVNLTGLGIDTYKRLQQELEKI